MLHEGWQLTVCLTDLPLQTSRRPVVAHASATHSVAVLSLPALGPIAVAGRARETTVRLVTALLAEDDEHTARHLGGPVRAHHGGIGLVAGVVTGNLRLLRAAAALTGTAPGLRPIGRGRRSGARLVGVDDVEDRVDEGQVGERLREVAEVPAAVRLALLGVQALWPGEGQQLAAQPPAAFRLADLHQRGDQRLASKPLRRPVVSRSRTSLPSAQQRPS